MRKILPTSLCIAAMLVMTQAPAFAQTTPPPTPRLGPVCVKAAEFANVFRLNFLGTGDGQFVGSGLDVTANRPLNASLHIVGGSAVLGLVAPIPPTGSAHGFSLTADVSIATLSGPGRCEAINNPEGCGTGIPITLAVVQCPQTTDTVTQPGTAQPSIFGSQQ
jgi:hypothetical protein